MLRDYSLLLISCSPWAWPSPAAKSRPQVVPIWTAPFTEAACSRDTPRIAHALGPGREGDGASRLRTVDAPSQASHAKIVGAYFRYSADWAEVGVADVSPDGWVGQRDPMVVVVARKRG